MEGSPADSRAGFGAAPEAPDPRQHLQPGLTERDVLQLWEVFLAFDLDQDGRLNPADIRSALLRAGFPAKRETVFQLLAEHDEAERGELDFVAFVRMCARNHRQRRDSRANVRSAYLAYDGGQRGFFDAEDLRRVAAELGERVEEEALDEMLAAAGGGSAGRVSFEQFYHAVTRGRF